MRRIEAFIAVCDTALVEAVGRGGNIEVLRTLARAARRPFGSRNDPRIVALLYRSSSLNVW